MESTYASGLRYHTASRPLKRPVKGRTMTLKAHPWQPVREGEPGYEQAPFERVEMNRPGFAMMAPNGDRVVMPAPSLDFVLQETLDYTYAFLTAQGEES